MATITKKGIQQDRQMTGVSPYGNKISLIHSLVTNASGAVVGSDSTSAIGATDKVRIGVLPAGMQLVDALAIVSDAFRATSTAKIGFEYVDGVDDTSVPQDDDYFFAALAMDAAGRTRAANTGVRPLVLPKDAYLIYTNAVVAQNAVGILDVVVDGVLVGVK